MQPTEQQQAVLDTVRDGAQNLTVSAVAGSGKTSTMVEACGVAGPKTCFVAFNKHIVDELKQRLRGTADTLTLHGLGFRLLQEHCPGITLDKGNQVKTKRILRALFPALHREGKGRWAGFFFLKEPWDTLPDVIDVCRQQTITPDTAAEIHAVRTACLRQGIDAGSESDSLYWERAAKGTRAVLEDFTSCDFTDMIAQPVYHGWVRPQYRTLFVDEAQDLSPMQHALALGSGERIVAVGDPRQAIMGFAGADVDSFPSMTSKLSERNHGCSTLPLSCCFRCPTSHLALARRLVPCITARDGAGEGILRNATRDQLLERSEPGDLVICRNTAPLVSLAFAFIRARKPCMVRGRGIGEGLKALVRRMRATTIPGLMDSIQRWRADQTEALQSEDGAPDEALQRVIDQSDSLFVLAADSSSVEELLQTIEELFSDKEPNNLVCLSTIHRAKGLEANRVWIYEPGLMPSRPGVMQELNLLYVALTRAKQELYLVDHETRRKDATTEQWVKNVANGFSRWELVERDEQPEESFSE